MTFVWNAGKIFGVMSPAVPLKPKKLTENQSEENYIQWEEPEHRPVNLHSELKPFAFSSKWVDFRVTDTKIYNFVPLSVTNPPLRNT